MFPAGHRLPPDTIIVVVVRVTEAVAP